MKDGLKINVPDGMELMVGPGESDSALVTYTVGEDGKTLILTAIEGISIDKTILAREDVEEEDEEEMTMEKFLAQIERTKA